ncbi:MAG TPA: twin-arginine translocase subunit TatC [Acidimicrobiales bacterium]|nr:twin-arginine translocase subunit TatC [Acidimicrobiales bacterium]
MATRIRILRRRPPADPEGMMSLAEHLAELRRRLIISILAVAAGGVIAFVFYESILTFFEHPYCQTIRPHACRLYVTGPLDPLSIRLKIAAYGGLVLALPVVLWELWRFITPGLNPKEKRYSVPFVLSSLVFFGLGGLVAWLTFPHALRFLSSIGGPTLSAIYSPVNYLRLIVLLMLVFGVAFEFPVVLVFLEVAGVVHPSVLVRWRRWAIVIIFAFAAVVTPSSDPFSMLAMAIPMVLFYEAAILVGKLLKR